MAPEVFNVTMFATFAFIFIALPWWVVCSVFGALFNKKTDSFAFKSSLYLVAAITFVYAVAAFS